MNEDKKLAGQFLRKIERLLRHSVPGGGLEPAASIEHWERTIAAAPESSREITETSRDFRPVALLRGREEDLGESVVAEMGAVHKLPPAERVARVKQINNRLMARVEDARHGSQLRQ